MSSKLLKNLAIFAAGLVTGGGLAVYLTREYFETRANARADEEISSVRKRLVFTQADGMHKNYGVHKGEQGVEGEIQGIPEDDYHRLMGTDDPVLKEKYRHLVRKFENPPLSEFMKQEAIKEGLEVEEDEEDEEAYEDEMSNPEDVETEIYLRRQYLHNEAPVHQLLPDDIDEFDDVEDVDSIIFTETTCMYYRGSGTYLDEDDAEIDMPEKMFGRAACDLVESGKYEIINVRNNRLEFIFRIEIVVDAWQDPDLIPEEEDIGHDDETPRQRMERIHRQKKRELFRLNSMEEDEEDGE